MVTNWRKLLLKLLSLRHYGFSLLEYVLEVNLTDDKIEWDVLLKVHFKVAHTMDIYTKSTLHILSINIFGAQFFVINTMLTLTQYLKNSQFG